MKKIISLVLAAAAIFSQVSASFAEGEKSAANIAHWDLATPSPWAESYVSKADIIGITTGFKVPWMQTLNRKQFCELAYNMINAAKEGGMEESGKSPFSDIDDAKVNALYEAGIISGKQDKAFAPDDKLTREEAAAILDRIGSFLGLAHHELYFEFNDVKSISDWAAEAVQIVCNMNVMSGIGDNKFAPKDGYTAEQAVSSLVRMFEIASRDEFTYMTFSDKMNINMPNDQNYMFSPLSIKLLLLMAANGADGATKREILFATGIKDLEQYNDTAKLMIEEYSKSDLLKLNISNSVWINSDKTEQRFSKEYTKKVADIFGAVSETVTDKTAVSKINKWVNDKTNGKIPSIISDDSNDFWAMLINAVYFKGRWQSEFAKSATKKDEFTERSGDKKSIDFMNKTSWLNYSETDGVKITKLPYLTTEEVVDDDGNYLGTNRLDGIDVSMYLMMSDNEFNTEEILNKAEISTKYISLSVPKFNIEYSIDLNDILKKIGIKKAFDKSAEFDYMFDGGKMWITDVMHKTYIKTDEEGTEAAAVSGIGMAGSSLPPEPVSVKYNKPFTFVIKDNINGEILFMGEYAFAN